VNAFENPLLFYLPLDGDSSSAGARHLSLFSSSLSISKGEKPSFSSLLEEEKAMDFQSLL